MGGVSPLGYRAQDRKLVIVDSEAELVRSIFRRYTELGSVRLLKKELEVRRIGSRSWASAAGRVIGGKPFSRGALYLILQNRIYRGEILHKGQSYRGEHPPISISRFGRRFRRSLPAIPPSATPAPARTSRACSLGCCLIATETA